MATRLPKPEASSASLISAAPHARGPDGRADLPNGFPASSEADNASVCFTRRFWIGGGLTALVPRAYTIILVLLRRHIRGGRCCHRLIVYPTIWMMIALRTLTQITELGGALGSLSDSKGSVPEAPGLPSKRKQRLLKRSKSINSRQIGIQKPRRVLP
jgi:hypothetical protein